MTENDCSKNSHIQISFQGRKPLYLQGQNDFALLNVSSLKCAQIKLLYTLQYQYWDILVEAEMEKIVIQVTSSDEDTDTATVRHRISIRSVLSH